MTIMRHISVAEAKAHFSDLLADAEHHGLTAVIEKRGRPVAHIVPVPKATRAKPPTSKSGTASVVAFHAALRGLTDNSTSAPGELLRDLEASRGRLE